MSEIYSPGSIAGPQGPAGAAGSQGSVTALASSVLPAPVNLFNYAAAQENYITNNDGTIGYHAPGSLGGGPPYVTNLLYCPGMTQLLLNYYLGAEGFGGGTYVQLFDANGNFISTTPSGTTNWNLAPGNVITLPGTQVYARLTLIAGPGGGAPPANAMIVAGTAASPATLPAAFVSFAADVSTVTATKMQASFNAGIAAWSESVLPPATNIFNYLTAQEDYITNVDGSISSSPGRGGGPAFLSGYMHCPGATQFVANTPIFNEGGGVYVQLFDALLNFIGTAATGTGGWATTSRTVLPLPGTQTYVRVTFASSASSGPGNVLKTMVSVGATLPTIYVPFVGNPTTPTVRKASELGCFFGGVMSTGLSPLGLTPNDDTAVLNAFLATASATNPIKLILDGCVSTTGLILSPNGYTTIEGIGWESGLCIRPGSNQDGICIGGYGAGVPWVNGEGAYNIALPARTAANIILRDFSINSFGASAYTSTPYTVAANTPVAGAPAHNIHGILLNNCSFAVIDNVQILNPPNSSIKLSNVDHVTVRDCRDDAGGLVHDCLHVDGPAEDIHVSGCTFEGVDDGLALNGPEGYGGDISRVTVSDCTFLGCDTLMRIYTSLQTSVMPTNNVHKARQVAITNCVGNVKLCVMSLGIAGGAGFNSTADVDQIEDVLIENCDLEVTVGGYGWIFLEDTAGLIQVRGCVYRSPTIATVPFIYSISSSVGHFLLSDCTILRNGDGSANPAFFVGAGAGAATGKLTLSGVRVLDELGSSYTAVPAALSIPTPLAELVVHSLDMDHIAALFDSSSTANVTVVRGAGLLGTGAQIADSVADNNVLYLSSNDGGAPSIKIGGTAKRLTLA